jgi:hypothetical protein
MNKKLSSKKTEGEHGVALRRTKWETGLGTTLTNPRWSASQGQPRVCCAHRRTQHMSPE